ncbi:MAG: hypothetical protein AMS26_22100 [Bacteroides sp. SM23_62]|nr:MAG: hypothetical protein AMS26_22100 [Bacteroides sp. SM23_62]
MALSLFAMTMLTGWIRIEDPTSAIIYEIPTISDQIDTDGRLAEQCWSDACIIREFYHAENPGPCTVDARILAVFDGKGLVFGFDLPALVGENEPVRCYLSDEYELRRVPNVTITLDPDHRHGIYYKFIIDPEGRKQDLMVDDESWTIPWTAGTRQEDGRFSAEVRVPVEKIISQPPAGGFWGFNISFSEAPGREACHSTPMDIKTSDAENFGHLLFKGTLTGKQIAGLKSSLPDIHRTMRENRLAANNAICGPILEEMPGALLDLQVGRQFSLKDGTYITCLGMDNQPVVRSNYPFFYEKFDNPDLQRLRKQYSLHEIIAPGKNDFEQILLLNEWLVNHVPFGSPPPIMPQALHILHHGLNGQAFYCTYMSFALMQMYCSLGFTARKITSVGHGTLDVWSNYWRKWMQIDPSRNSYFRLQGTAVPLNSNEIRREFHRNGGVDMEMVFGKEQRAERVTLERRDRDGAYQYRQEGYEWVAYKTRNNFFEIPFTWWNFDYLIVEDEYNENKTWQYRGERDVRDRIGTRTGRIGDVFWTLNQAYIHLYDHGTATLKVQLETHTPNFDRFEVSVDKGEWQASSPVLSWELHRGQNHLKARSVNKFGVTGPEHKIVLKVN